MTMMFITACYGAESGKADTSEGFMECLAQDFRGDKMPAEW